MNANGAAMAGESFLVLFAGQSNMLGHAKALDGDKPVNDCVLAWSNEEDGGVWRRAELGRSPFNERPGQPNNAALHFADRLQRDTQASVYLVGCPVNGSTLLSWSTPQAPNMARFLTNVAAALETPELKNANVRHADTLLWSQGESDDDGATMVKEPKVATLESYAAEFRGMVGYLRAQTWWLPEKSKLVASELVDDGWLDARNDFYRSSEHWPEDCLMGVSSSVGMGHVGDRAHYNGEALQMMGIRMYEVRGKLIGC